MECAIGGLRKCPKFGCRGHTFWQWSVTVDFDNVSLQKYGQFIIQSLCSSSVKFQLRGSSEMSQIHRQWWHFLRLVGYCWFWWYFITKVWSVHNKIIIQSLSCSSVEFHIGGLRKCHEFGCRGNTFRRWSVTVDFDDFSLEKYNQLINGFHNVH